MSRGTYGAPGHLVSLNPKQAKKNRARRLRREEARWAAKSGPVTVRKITDPKPDST